MYSQQGTLKNPCTCRISVGHGVPGVVVWPCLTVGASHRVNLIQGAKKIIFTACHSGKLRLAFTSPDVISTSPKNVLTSGIYLKVLLLFEFLKKHHLPVGQVKNRIH